MEQKNEIGHNFKLNPYSTSILGVLALTGLFAAAFYSFAIDSILEKKITASEELARKGSVDVLIIKDEKCEDCFDLKQIVDTIRKENINISSEKSIDYASDEAKELIKKHAIEKVPALILSGELEKDAKVKDMLTQAGGITDGNFVFKQPGFPNTLVSSGEVKGRIEMTLVTANDCANCFDGKGYVGGLKGQFGLPIANEAVVDYKSEEGKQLIKQYKIASVPTFVLIGDLASYPNLNNIQKFTGDTLVLEAVNPPYISIPSGKIRGIVKAVTLSDKKCPECFSVNDLDPKRLGLYLSDLKDFDISSAEGKRLIAKYRIKLIPTVIITGDVGAYTALKQTWSTYGTIELDGAYVLRDVIRKIGTYKDLTTNTVKEKEEQQQQQQ